MEAGPRKSEYVPLDSPPAAWSLLSGELHYWRHARGEWSALLDAAAALGVECIGTYVPWNYHERADGGCDFEELVAFVELARARGLRLFVRPGPYIYAEWHNLGVPDDVVALPKHTAEFRRRAGGWIAAVMRALEPFLGDPVVALQADNEIDPMPHFYGEDQGFADWLRRRYASVEALNRAWGSEHAAFEDALPTLYPFVEDARYRDGQRYRYDLATDYAQWVVAEFRQRARGVPIVLNSWPFVNAQHWRELAELADVYGIDPYPENECRDGFRELREQYRLLRAVTPRPFVAELGAGTWKGRPCDFTPEHYRLTAFTALAGGVRGWNWYMLADRDNWSGAPIDAHGRRVAALAPAFEAVALAFRELRDAPPPRVSCAVTWSWAEHQTAATRGRRVDDALLEVLHEMGIEYEFADLDRLARELQGPSETGRRAAGQRAGGWGAGGIPAVAALPRLVFVAGEVPDARPLWAHAARGGAVVLFQRWIEGCVRPDGSSHPAPSNLEVSLGFVTDRPVFAYRSVPGEPIVAVQRGWSVDPEQRRHMQLALGRRYITGYVASHGLGHVAVVGCAPSVEAVLALHRRFGVELPALPRTAGVHAARRGDRLVVLNPGPACRATIELPEGTRELEMERCSGAVVTLAGPR